MPKTPKLKPFDLALYIGSEERGIPPRYNAVELVVLSAGAIGLFLALNQRGPVSTRKAARRVSDANRVRFHRHPQK